MPINRNILQMPFIVLFRYPSPHSEMEKLLAGDAEQVSHFLYIQLSVCWGEVSYNVF